MAPRILFFLAALAIAAPAAQAQLVSQTVVGVRRICTYNNPDPARRRSEELVRRAVGRGEPCPARYPRPAAARPAAIPMMATLVRKRRQAGQHFCDYQYLGRVYSRPVRAIQICPRTPHFFD